MNFSKAVDLVLKAEGGYSNVPEDTGGETFRGITRKGYPTLSFWPAIDKITKVLGKYPTKFADQIKYNASVDSQMGNTGFNEIQQVYLAQYWNKCKCENLPNTHRYPLFDCAVNCGVGQASKFYQRAVGVADDGAIGPKTIAAATAASEKVVLGGFFERWVEFYHNIVKNKPNQEKFLDGWLKRVRHAQANNS